jgi:hypothetical protein
MGFILRIFALFIDKVIQDELIALFSEYYISYKNNKATINNIQDLIKIITNPNE